MDLPFLLIFVLCPSCMIRHLSTAARRAAVSTFSAELQAADMEQEIGNSGALSSNKAALLTELLTQKLLALDNIDTQVHSPEKRTILSLQCSLSNVGEKEPSF